MKTKLILLLALLVGLTNAQITFSGSYTAAPTLVKMHQSGYKYLRTTLPASVITLYNVNHSVWKTMTIPVTNYNQRSVMYVSENLFDTDNLVEYALYCSSQASTPPYAVTAKLFIFKENGNLVFSIDSAGYYWSTTYSQVFNNTEPVFFDGVSTKLRCSILGNAGVQIRQDIYELPGTIPCVPCCTATTESPGGINSNRQAEDLNTGALFYPNPASAELSLRYQLPADYQHAEILIHDLEGRQLEKYQVTSDFHDLLIPAKYDNGLYMYSLVVDGRIIKTEKIILNK